MRNYILSENVLTDNELFLADKNKVFKGGYIALIKEHKYLNAWADKESIKRFKNLKTLSNYLNKNYPLIDLDIFF